MKQEEKEFYQALQELKDSLAQIKSASEQVNATVDAYGKTGIAISSYSKTLDTVTRSINELYKALESSHKTYNLQIDESLNKIISTKDALVADLSKAQSSLKSNVCNIETDFANAADKTTGKFESDANEIKKTFEGAVTKTTETFKSEADKITRSFDGATIKAAETFKSEADEAVKSLNDAVAKLNENIRQLKEEIKKEQLEQCNLIAKSNEELRTKANAIASAIETNTDKIEKNLKTSHNYLLYISIITTLLTVLAVYILFSMR